ncbi:cytochrome P450 [Coniophora puteana RWD-64-598 SS2]|uniref:Cytochrome P450 n=1 Tax=Coniophora puteana (strain RWD-64-598) TaxID=741705 RepID=A0A5M3MYZ0_CONPW|nr:cytochrome P450 [Coniophora puteana RWD-64-598 SS2]EIW84368.1 cytochrome P450 [Coniophora puteana RWD-64-598 SS2]
MGVSISLILPIGLFVWTLARYTAVRLRGKNSLPLPPGPAQLPLLGAALEVDGDTPWVTYREWAAKYGDIVSCHFFGRRVVVLNSEKAADDLLEKRSRIYSDRADISTIPMSGWDLDISYGRYNSEWRLYRRLFQQTFREQKVPDYRTTQLAAAHRLLMNMDTYPAEKLFDLLSLCTASAILSTIYGYEVNTLDDPLFNINDKAVESGFPLLTPEKSIVPDTFPFIKYLPAWLPGMSIVRNAQISKHWTHQYVNFPYNFTMEKMQSDPAFACVLSEMIREGEENGQSIPVPYLKKFAATSFIAGADTSGSVLLSLVAALVQNPAVQKRAQAELRTVVGDDRLPTFGDRASLPYIDAMIREAMRWGAVVPLGVPHFSTEDDVYEGYFIPKGSIVTANTWAMSRDPRRYPDPEAFLPERFLTKDGELTDDDVRFTFGWGRRICPGRYSASAAIWIATVSMLTAYSFERAKDENGAEIDAVQEWTTGIARKPKQLPMRVVPRFDRPRLEQMVKEAQHA